MNPDNQNPQQNNLPNNSINPNGQQPINVPNNNVSNSGPINADPAVNQPVPAEPLQPQPSNAILPDQNSPINANIVEPNSPQTNPAIKNEPSAQAFQPAQPSGMSIDPNPQVQPVNPNSGSNIMQQPYSTSAMGQNLGNPMPAQPGSGKSKKIIIIVGVISLLLGIAALLFYFLYWTRSDVVYSRFQGQISKIITQTLTTDVKLINNVSYSVEVTSQGGDIPIKVDAKGRAIDSGNDLSANVSFSNATINLASLAVNDKGASELYLKYKGIQQFYKALLANPKTKNQAQDFAELLPILNKYDDKWISVNLFGLLDSSNQNETITQDDYKTLNEKLVPVFNKRYFSPKPADAVIITSNPKSDTVAGKSAWSYEIKSNDTNFNKMIDEMITAVDSTTLSDTKKKIVKELLKDSKVEINDNKSENPPDTAYLDTVDQYSFTTTNKIWLDKLTALPLKFSTETKYTASKKLTSMSALVVEISSISPSKIVGKISNTSSTYDFDGKTENSKSVFVSDVTIDNSKSNISVISSYDPDSKNNNDLINIKFLLQPVTDKTPITKPAKSVTLEQVVKEITQAQQTTATNTGDSDTDPNTFSEFRSNFSKLFGSKK